jgi:hypothetical protein
MSIKAMANATLSKVTQPGTADGFGDVVYGAGVTVSERVVLTEPTRAQLISLAARIADASAVVYVTHPFSQPLAPRVRLTVTLDGGSAQTLEIIHRIERVKAGGLSHFECFVMEVQT